MLILSDVLLISIGNERGIFQLFQLNIILVVESISEIVVVGGLNIMEVEVFFQLDIDIDNVGVF